MMHPILHRTAQPIALHEFTDALRAAAPPRFPHGRAPVNRRVGLAISGGVDSMALAFLCAEARKVQPLLPISDAPTSGFTAIVVDHGLRTGSDTEAAAVAKALTRMGHRAQVCPLRWPGAGGKKTSGSKPKSLSASSSIETTARQLRYRCLGMQLASMRIVSLLLAHHEDDQYETVLMRLLSGYGLNGGIRGLRGMRAAGDLPECHGIYGAHQSGLLDEQRQQSPYVLLRPSRGERRDMQRAFREEMEAGAAAESATLGEKKKDEAKGGDDVWSSLRPTDMRMDDMDDDDLLSDTMLRRQYLPFTGLPWSAGLSSGAGASGAPPLAPIDSEDMGIMAYRPLLHFAKERLVATCLANNVPWFEDHTNADATLTMRNALRHVARNHTLPRALQKPAILQLAARCDQQARQHEAEARRLLMRHGVLEQFTPNVGTLLVRLPRLQGWTRRRPWARRARADAGAAAAAAAAAPAVATIANDWYTAASRDKRRRYLRTIAALAVQKLLSFVTPETKITPVSQLQSVVNTLFPELADPDNAGEAAVSDPKSFIICGVHFMPVLEKTGEKTNEKTGKPSDSPAPRAPMRSWYLARAPHSAAERITRGAGTSASPLAVWYPGQTIAHRWDKPPTHWNWSNWTRWSLYDGRFWVRTRTRLPVHVVLQPFDKAHSKPFREALAAAAGDEQTSPAASQQLPIFLATLKAHAPGKVRYTLPALYVTSDIAWALAGDAYWPDVAAAEDVWARRDVERQQIVAAGDYVGEGDLQEEILVGTSDYCDYYSTHPPVYRSTGLGRRDDLFMWERHLRTYERAQNQRRLAEAEGASSQASQTSSSSSQTSSSSSSSTQARPVDRLLALPTLGIHIPGIEDWLQWEVRYRKVDKELLESGQAAVFDRLYDAGDLERW
ncbi:MAG: hypothetical protein STHCBS139747_005781 [Sporothrix thermara]